MATMKFLYSVLKYFFTVVWGLTIVDILPLMSWESVKHLEMFMDFDNAIKTITALLGLIYFAIEIPSKLKKAKLERDILKEDLIKKKFENQSNVTVTETQEEKTE